MTNIVFVLRTMILLALIGMSFLEWKRARLLEELLGMKDARIEALERASLLHSTIDTILKAEAATEGAFQIHVPMMGCPPGWTLSPELFRQSDGTVRPGCVLIKSYDGQGRDVQVQTDYLLPGESVSVMIPLSSIRELDHQP